MENGRWTNRGNRVAAFVLVNVSGCLNHAPLPPDGHLQIASRKADERCVSASQVDTSASAKRPIEMHDTVFIEEMTWMEVRDALAAGKTTVIVPTGGIEENGPYLVTGKHNYIIRATAEVVARDLGNAFVAPVVAFVPEGRIDPPTEHMKFPGTISVSDETFVLLLTDICASLRAHGFRDIVLIGDSGGNQRGLNAVATVLNAKWIGGNTRVHFIPEYYNYPSIDEWLANSGIKQIPEGFHDDFAVTASLTAVDPVLVRAKQRQAAGKFRINAVDLAPVENTAAWGRRIIQFRADATVKAIRKSISEVQSCSR